VDSTRGPAAVAPTAATLRTDSAAHWTRLELIIDEALDATEPAREAIIHASCGADVGLRDAALTWLRGCSEPSSQLDVPVSAALIREAIGVDWQAAAVSPSAAPHRRDGAVVGRWRLLREIGRGGMGVVYLAERADHDVPMRVALKFMRHVDAFDAVSTRRFHAERRILAALDHPSIARLVDVGIDDGLPWLAMEYIDGAPIDDWCDTHVLSLETRVALFCGVADAVQHAHVRLVVHRDLKPANILVSYDGRPTLLDFGIAKLLEADEAEDTRHPPTLGDSRTRPGWQPMTRAYASPEQQRGDAPSTASDVYALGVLLHLLLTGRLPVPGILPSTAVRRDGTVGGAQATVTLATHRASTPARLARRLRGDLDTIVARAIDEDPARRYATADAFAADCRRHLRGLPVLARRDSVTYRMRKLVARHRVGAAASAMSVCLAVAFTLNTALQSQQLRIQADSLRQQAITLRSERDKATEVTQFLKDVLASANPYQSGAEPPTLRDVLDRGAANIERRLRDRPEIRAQLYSAIAPAYFGLGDWVRAGDLAEQAVTLRRHTTEAPDPELAPSLVYLANVRLNQQRATEAEAHVREALSIFRDGQHAGAPELTAALSTLGAALQKQGKLTEAGEVLDSLLRGEQSRRVAEPLRVAQLQRNLAHVRRDQRRFPEAIALYAKAYAQHRVTLGHDHPETANSAVNLGNAYLLANDVSRALPLLHDGVLTKRRVLGLAHPDVAADQLTYARALARAGRTAESNQRFHEAQMVLARLSEHPAVRHP